LERQRSLNIGGEARGRDYGARDSLRRRKRLGVENILAESWWT
jgi:hypothetical protein